MAKSARRKLHSRHLSIASNGAGLCLKFMPPFAVTLGRIDRHQEVCRRVKAILRSSGIMVRRTAEGVLTAEIANKPLPDVRLLIGRIDAAIDAYGRDRLPGRHVELVLGIAPQERRKWTKDGRLPRSGSVSFKRGEKTISLPLYRADKIASLAADPTEIEEWRQADRQLNSAKEKSPA